MTNALSESHVPHHIHTSKSDSCYSNYNVPDATTLDSIISSVISFEERKQIESVVFLSLHDLIIPTHKPNRKKAPRSQNSFLIFRKNYQARMTYEKGPGYSSQLKTVSKHAKDIWRMLDIEEKSIYERIANIATMVHKVMWPNYSYRPNRKEHKRKESNLFHPAHSHSRSSTSPLKDPSTSCLYHDHSNSCGSRGSSYKYQSLHPNYNEYVPRPSYNKCSPYYIPRLDIQPLPLSAPIQQLEMRAVPSITPYDKSILNTVDKYFKI